MGLEVDDHHEPNSTPKLSLSKLPCKPKEPTQMLLTPPLHPSVSVPFRWEEAPGKPRAVVGEAAAPPPPPPPAALTGPDNLLGSKNKVAKRLDLPPRMLHEDSEMTIMPSPVVFDGPYVARSLSLACTLSFRNGPGSEGRGGLRPMKRGCCGKFGSSRWGSFKVEENFDRGSFDFSQSLGEIFRSEKNVKITRLRRVRSFFNFSGMNSNLLDIYASFKHAVSWERRR